jgi:uncharacterized Zn-binding protein involved in type VI secretion
MPGFLFHVGATALCPHAGQVTVIPSQGRVLLNGMPAATLGDTFLVAGCPFTIPPGKPQPCVKVQWLVPSARIQINGQPAILQSSTGLCQSPEQIPQGPPSIVATQTRVSGV